MPEKQLWSAHTTSPGKPCIWGDVPLDAWTHQCDRIHCMQGASARNVKGSDWQKSLSTPSTSNLQPQRCNCTDKLPDTHSVHRCAAMGCAARLAVVDSDGSRSPFYQQGETSILSLKGRRQLTCTVTGAYRALQDEDNLREALRYSAAMLGELRTSSLTPQKYFELYMQVFDELRHLEVGTPAVCSWNWQSPMTRQHIWMRP